MLTTRYPFTIDPDSSFGLSSFTPPGPLVANILPFLLLGGFSKTEVISYLKAKLEAAKSVMTSVDAKKEEDDTLVERADSANEGHNEMVMRQELPIEEEKKDDPSGVSNG